MLAGTARLAARRKQRSSQVPATSPLDELGHAITSAKSRVAGVFGPHFEGFASYVESVAPTSMMCSADLGTCSAERGLPGCSVHPCIASRAETLDVHGVQHEPALEQELTRLLEDAGRECVVQRIGMRKNYVDALPEFTSELTINSDHKVLSKAQAGTLRAPREVCGLATRTRACQFGKEFTWDELFPDGRKSFVVSAADLAAKDKFEAI